MSDGGGEHLAAGLEEDRAGDRDVAAQTRRGEGPTLADALKSAEESRASGVPADPEPSPDQAHVDAMQQQILNAVPGDHMILAGALREPNVPMQLLALDRLGEMAEWDQEARRLLETFRHEVGDEGLQRRAADLLSRVARLPGASGPEDPAGRHPDGDEPG